MTELLGLVSKAGTYGGTFAHRDIAFEFGTWLSSKFIKRKRGLYAENADMINKIIFGITAKQGHVQDTDLKGNMRNYATTTQNTIIGNLESFNFKLIRKGASEEARQKALGQKYLLE